uniref:(northern house mosquito) hypothetical protein n=1 Tax=Culex pipiens TaxID=7175 RepID=A0A8D8G9J3_CULPI
MRFLSRSVRIFFLSSSRRSWRSLSSSAVRIFGTRQLSGMSGLVEAPAPAVKRYPVGGCCVGGSTGVGGGVVLRGGADTAVGTISSTLPTCLTRVLPGSVVEGSGGGGPAGFGWWYRLLG